MPQELPSQYDPKAIEKKWFEFWQSVPLFHAVVTKDKKPFTIVIPPPNVTGILHMGHALNNTIQDILIRVKRMQGYEALWMPGTDHAGIATQNVVERQIAKDGLKRQDLGREKFLERVWDWKNSYGSTIIHQLKKLGATCDWPRERFTMDEGYSEAVKEVFVRLYEKGLIYQGDYIINWCPRCQTALADEEAPRKDLAGKLYYIKYPIKVSPGRQAATPPEKRLKSSIVHRPSSINYIIVATTRPETMLGDTAVAVNPSDKRYKGLIGKTLILPLVEREINIIADRSIDKEFGTGAVKVTPAHDTNDYAMGKEHDLEFINIMHPNAVLNSNAGKYEGMDRFEARKAILEDLKERNLLVKIEEHRHAVGHCYRCHTIVEPYLSKQWFVKMKPLSKPALEAVKNGTIKFTPKRWTKVYLNWMENIRDWCISRQIWWGHRLPVYYCKVCLSGEQNEGNGVIVSRVKPDKCPHCGNTDLEQDPDVLDTWFSSWLWPFATFGWPFGEQKTEDGRQKTEEKKKELKYFYPTSVLVTAPEIIFFWVARMIMAGYEFMGEKPFSNVYIHGTVRDEEGKKMSKSLGNSIDPLKIIEQYGTDALRFSLISTAASGSDIYLSAERFEQGRNFANKIWNASRFIMMNIKDGPIGAEIDINNLKTQDAWILASLNDAIKKVTKSIDSLKFNEALNVAYDFFWHKFCDWYVEIAKFSIDDKNTKECLLYCLKQSLLLLSPFMPFITDEIYSNLPGEKPQALAVGNWPVVKKEFDDKIAIVVMQLVFSTVFSLRNLRAELNILPQTSARVRLSTTTKKKKQFESVLALVKRLANISELEVTTQVGQVKNSLSALVDKDTHLYLLLESLADAEKEKVKIDKQLADLIKQKHSKETMLANKEFIKKAPEAVVERERKRVIELIGSIKRLNEVRDAFA
ncbi:MAG: valine--tRNA ligase [Candidatus Omnitrophica bacterium CG_4_10_14_0_2_um_filter_44_9]|nr:MAG: valine--tRNA ligase [Candidatus Omnitrophica bacterium CG_4_10_14_0_8_um_filter_44_12]PIZ83468.1 MAG: valine--tRNA ligase [Candidatus Omnitrophica bacterium CG_4_10_14_0_2_um_filter_44_9]